VHSQGPSEQKPIKNFAKRERGRIEEMPKFLGTPVVSGTSNFVRTFIGSIGTKAH